MSTVVVRWLFASGAVGAIAAGFSLLHAESDLLTVQEQPSAKQVRPAGLNLGLWTSWGDSQFQSNVLKNPGFESTLDRSLLIVSRTDGAFVWDDTDWLSRADHFWAGGTFSVRSGAHAGKSGQIVDSWSAPTGSLPRLQFDQALDLAPGDVVAISVEGQDPNLPQWWIDAKAPAMVVGDENQRRPDSPGRRSARMEAQPGADAELSSYLDTLSERGGKLLKINGEWTLSFWARCLKGPCRFDVSFRRMPSHIFASQSYDATGSWEHIRIPFTARDVDEPGTLQLRFHVDGSTSPVLLLDDVELKRNSDSESAFPAELISTLQTLRPGYVRDWQGQLGDTAANRLETSAFGRKPSRYRPGVDETDQRYSLPDFLDLSARVGSIPWVVVPTTFADGECEEFGRELAKWSPAKFPEIVVEFGNENWNGLFRPAGIPDPKTYAEVANRCYDRIRAAAPGAGLTFMLNGPPPGHGSLDETARVAPSGTGVAIAPYTLYEVPAGLTLDERLDLLRREIEQVHKRVEESVRSSSREISVYEMNLHAVDGNASAMDRLPLLAGAPSGAALAWKMLGLMQLGINRQCVYTLAQLDTRLNAVDGYAPLWGLVRGISGDARWRPTGHAMALLNKLLPGDVYPLTAPDGAPVTGIAIRNDRGWSYALSGISSEPRNWRIRLPEGAAAPASATVLTAVHPQDTNEEVELVKPAPFDFSVENNELAFQLPPWSVVIFEQAGATH